MLRARGLYLALFGWLFYCGLYVSTLQSSLLHLANGSLSLIVETGCDLLVMYLAWDLAQKTQQAESTFLQLFAWSFLLNALGDGTYNLIVNVLGISHFSTQLEVLFDAPFTGCLMLQCIAWYRLFKLQKQKSSTLSLFFYAPFLLSGIVMLASFLYLPSWHISVLSAEGLFNIAGAILEVVCFSYCVSILFLSTDNRVSLLCIGILIIFASDFIIRFSEVHLTLSPGSLFELTWTLGTVLVAYALWQINKKAAFSFDISLGTFSNLKSQISIWLFSAMVFSTAILICLNIFLSDVNVMHLYNIPATLVMYSILSTALSSLFSSRILEPFTHLTPEPEEKENQSTSEIKELQKIETCIHQGLNAIETKSKIEKDLLHEVENYADNIRNPAHALTIISKELTDIPDDKRKLLQRAAHEINTETASLLKSLRDAIKKPETKINTPLATPHKKCILIDDNATLTLAWELDATDCGYDIAVFNDADEFKATQHELDKCATLYIDINLQKSYSGIELAKWAYEAGFPPAILITGGDTSDIAPAKWIKKAQGKTPPFCKRENQDAI